MLEESDDIPPTGQFIGVNGRGYILKAGEPAEAPVELLAVLDAAVISVPITGDGRARPRLQGPPALPLPDSSPK